MSIVAYALLGVLALAATAAGHGSDAYARSLAAPFVPRADSPWDALGLAGVVAWLLTLLGVAGFCNVRWVVRLCALVELVRVAGGVALLVDQPHSYGVDTWAITRFTALWLLAWLSVCHTAFVVRRDRRAPIGP